jgi:hypothetical protein
VTPREEPNDLFETLEPSKGDKPLEMRGARVAYFLPINYIFAF